MSKDELIERLSFLRREQTEHYEKATVSEAIDVIIECCEFLMNDHGEFELPVIGDYFLPPWNIYENPEKTEGWMAFQKVLKDNPGYYA